MTNIFKNNTERQHHNSSTLTSGHRKSPEWHIPAEAPQNSLKPSNSNTHAQAQAQAHAHTHAQADAQAHTHTHAHAHAQAQAQAQARP